MGKIHPVLDGKEDVLEKVAGVTHRAGKRMPRKKPDF